MKKISMYFISFESVMSPYIGTGRRSTHGNVKYANTMLFQRHFVTSLPCVSILGYDQYTHIVFNLRSDLWGPFY